VSGTGRRRPVRRDAAARDAVAADRQASAQDRDERFYARKRAAAARRRLRLERDRFDPAPPSDTDWTMPEDVGDGIRRLGPPQPVGDALTALVRQRGWEEALRNATLWSRWSDIVGETLAERCQPVRLRRGVLTVRAESQAWATQLRYLTTQLRERTAEVIGGQPVSEVTITVGPLDGGPGGQPSNGTDEGTNGSDERGGPTRT
jgi:hypothetical protein